MPKTNNGRPAWLKRALDPRTPMYTSSYMDDPATINTASTYSKELGGEILFPTIREVKGVLKKYSVEEAEKIALEKKDYVLIKGTESFARPLAIQLSKKLSEQIHAARKKYNQGGTNMVDVEENKAEVLRKIKAGELRPEQPPKPFVGTPALDKYKKLFPEANLTPAMEHTIILEGFSQREYKDTEDNPTIGVGLTGKYFPKKDETLHDAFMRAYADKEATARDLFDNFDTFSPELQTQIMSGVYRGDFKSTHNTVKAINRGDFHTASEQFLLDGTGKDFSKDYKKARDDKTGVQGRLEAIQQAFAAEAARRRDSFATAEATVDQMERLRKEKEEGAAILLSGQPPEPELQPNRDIQNLFKGAKGGTPMIKERENDEMVQVALAQDSRETDPVSGNEIPLGATAEGVRDDQTAAISPGEFVIPQYAVNYHGLDFYMKSLNVAKDGLQQMEQMGMTGRPDEATLSDDMSLPAMKDEIAENQNRELLDSPIDTEMFMRGGLQTPAYNFSNGGFVEYQSGGTYTTPTALTPPTPAVPTPTVNTPSVGMTPTYYQQAPATPMPMVQPQVTPQVPIGAPIPSYTDYQGPSGGLPGGYGVQEYKNKDTGASIFLTTIGGKLPAGVKVPPGYVTAEEYNNVQKQEPALTPTAPTEIDRGGVTEHDLEMEAKNFEEEQERELQERIDARKSAIAAALGKAGTQADQDLALDYGGTFPLVDPKYGMWIDGVYTRDPRILEEHQDSKSRSLITNDSPLGRAVNWLAGQLWPIRVLEGLGKHFERKEEDGDDGADQQRKDRERYKQLYGTKDNVPTDNDDNGQDDSNMITGWRQPPVKRQTDPELLGASDLGATYGDDTGQEPTGQAQKIPEVWINKLAPPPRSEEEQVRDTYLASSRQPFEPSPSRQQEEEVPYNKGGLAKKKPRSNKRKGKGLARSK